MNVHTLSRWMIVLVFVLPALVAGDPTPMRADAGLTITAPTLAPRYVAPGGTDGDNDCTNSAAPCGTLQRAIDASSAGDEIRVAAGTYTGVNVRPRQDITTTGTVTQVVYINKTVTIRGGYTTAFADPPDPEANPTTLDAQGQGRVMYITGLAIAPTIEGLRLTAGQYDGDSGGGIFIYRGEPTIDHCRVFSNTADKGGGVYLYATHATLSNNVISHNHATQGGGIYLYWGYQDATLSHNVISYNSVSSKGGGIAAYVDSSSLSDNVISHNTSNYRGGGLDLDNSSGIKLNGNTITANTAADGGGLYLYFNDLTLINSIVADNQAIYGSGLRAHSSDITALHCTIAHNIGPGGTGSQGIYTSL